MSITATCACKHLSIEYKNTSSQDTCTSTKATDSFFESTKFTFLDNNDVIGTKGESRCDTDLEQGVNRYSCIKCNSELFQVSLTDSSIIGIKHHPTNDEQHSTMQITEALESSSTPLAS